MNTEKLLSALRLCRGAMDAAPIYPIFSHYCFLDDVVFGFNDMCAVIAPLSGSGLSAGVPGDALFGVLQTLGNEVELEQGKDKVTLRSGKAVISLASLPPESFLFEPPNEKWQLEFEPTKLFFEGLKRCSQTVSEDAQSRQFIGVSIQFDKALMLYSSDNIRLSTFDARGSEITKNLKGQSGAWMLSGKACMLLVDSWQAISDQLGEDTKCTLRLGKSWVQLETGLGSECYAKTIPESPPDYQGVLKKIVPKDVAWQAIPEGFNEATLRASVLTDKESTAAFLLQASGKELKVSLVGYQHSFTDKFSLKTPANVELKIGVSKLLQSLEGAQEFSLTNKCVGVRAAGYTCWVSSMSSEG